MPNEPLKAVVMRVTQESSLDAVGQLHYATAVQFKVGDHGPFTVTVPREAFTADAARRLMQPTVDAINALVK